MVSERGQSSNGSSAQAEEWILGVSFVDEPEWLKSWRIETGKALGLCKVSKFTGKYWSQWKNAILLNLQSVGLHIILQRNFVLTANSKPESRAQFNAACVLVQNFLVDHLSNELNSDLAGCAGAREMWIKLLDTYENTGIDAWTHIFDSWGAHYQGNMPLEQYIREEEDFRERLKALGKDFGEDMRVHYLTKGLNQTFIVQARLYKSIGKSYDWMVAEFRSMALQEEKRPGGSKPQANVTGQRPKQRPQKRCYKCGDHHSSTTCSAVVVYNADKTIKPLCFNCREHGHYAKDCPKKTALAGASS
jgi:hypothetical protein